MEHTMGSSVWEGKHHYAKNYVSQITTFLKNGGVVYRQPLTRPHALHHQNNPGDSLSFIFCAHTELYGAAYISSRANLWVETWLTIIAPSVQNKRPFDTLIIVYACNFPIKPPKLKFCQSCKISDSGTKCTVKCKFHVVWTVWNDFLLPESITHTSIHSETEQRLS